MTKMTSRIPGNIVIHQVPLKIYSNPDRINEPSDGLVTGIPNPRKLRAASLMTALATWMVEMTITDVRVLGRTCRTMIILLLSPITRAASTYSLFFSPITAARTVRAYTGHSARPIITTSKGTARSAYLPMPKATWKMALIKMATIR